MNLLSFIKSSDAVCKKSAYIKVSKSDSERISALLWILKIRGITKDLFAAITFSKYLICGIKSRYTTKS